MITIIRFETPDQVGLYGSGNCKGISDFSRHITPSSDSLLWETLADIADSDDEYDILDVLREYRFGFASNEQVFAWMYRPEWLITLHKRGLIVSEYHCRLHDVVIGHTQAMFKNHVTRQTYLIPTYFV